VQQLHHGSQRNLPEVRHLRLDERLLLIPALSETKNTRRNLIQT
jgi:hypothetical protein